jgi:hypothetical protein
LVKRTKKTIVLDSKEAYNFSTIRQLLLEHPRSIEKEIYEVSEEDQKNLRKNKMTQEDINVKEDEFRQKKLG